MIAKVNTSCRHKGTRLISNPQFLTVLVASLLEVNEMTPAREPKQHFRGILHASQRHLGGIWEIGGIWRPSESGGPFSIIKMGSKRRERPFYRRVAKVGRTKCRKTHGSSVTAPAGHTRGTHSPTVTQAARNPTAKRCLGNQVRANSQLGRGACL